MQVPRHMQRRKIARFTTRSGQTGERGVQLIKAVAGGALRADGQGSFLLLVFGKWKLRNALRPRGGGSPADIVIHGVKREP